MVSDTVLVGFISGSVGIVAVIVNAVAQDRSAERTQRVELRKIHSQAVTERKIDSLITLYSALVESYQTAYARFDDYDEIRADYDTYVAQCRVRLRSFLDAFEAASIFLTVDEENVLDEFYAAMRRRVDELEGAEDDPTRRGLIDETRVSRRELDAGARAVLKRAVNEAADDLPAGNPAE